MQVMLFSNASLKRLILPLFLDQLLLISVGTISTMMISYAGEHAVSAVSLVEMINMLLLIILTALATGGAVVISQYIGGKDEQQARFAASQLVMITGVISFGITMVVAILHKPILQLFFGRIEVEVMRAAMLYLLISAFSYPFYALYNSGAAIYRSMGLSRIPMIVSIGMNATNLALNAVGIFAMNWGVEGVAAAAILSRILGGTVMLLLCFNKKNAIYIRLQDIVTYHKSMVRKILKIAVPSGVENGLGQLGRLLLVSVVALLGTSAITANGVANSLIMVSISFPQAVNLAIVTVVGQCIGAGDFNQAEYYVKKMMKIAYIGSIVLSLAEVAILHLLLDLFQISAESRGLAYQLVLIHNLIAVFLWPLAFVLPNGLRAAGDVRFTMVTSILAMFVFRLVFSYILGIVLGLGIIGIWFAMCIDWVVRSLFYTYRFRSRKWTQFRLV